MTAAVGGATTLIAALAARFAVAPDDRALVVDGGADVTYRAWAGRSDALAAGLVARGVTAGDRIALRFDPSTWSDFAVAYLGVLKAGAVAVLLPPGLDGGDLARALAGSAPRGVLCARPPATAGEGTWVATPAAVEGGTDPGGTGGARRHDAGPADLAELVHRPAPFAPARTITRTHGDLLASVRDLPVGPFVHAWAPGTAAGQLALAHVLAAPSTSAATVARFTVEGFCRLVGERRAVACGLPPGLATAVAASGPAVRDQLATVRRLVLSDPVSLPGAGTALRALFAGAAVTGLGPLDRAPSPTLPAAAPVAISQDAMLWHEQFTPGSFNLPCLVRRYRGRLDTAALERALAALADRHEPLRTTFELVDGAPRQIVHHDTAALELTDLAELGEEARDAETARLLADASGRPFDLVQGPLFSPRLVRLGADDHLLVVRLHHTVYDDWSVDVFRRDLSALYASFREGRPSPLPEPATTFGSFARTERSRLAGEAGAADLTWWRTQLAGAPLSVQLPIASADGPARDRPVAGAPVRRDLPDALATRLRALSRELRATPFMTTLAAFAVLVARITRQPDLVLASVVAHRNRAELEPLIGCFTKKVLVRLSVEDDPPFSELVARARSSVLGAMAHQDPAFEAVVAETLGPAAAAHGVVPQIAVVFQGETPQPTTLVLPGIDTSGYDVPVDARRERHFSAGPHDDDRSEGPADTAVAAPVWGDGAYLGTFLILSLLANPDEMALVARGVFDRPLMARLLERFEALLAAAAADPHRRVSEIAAGLPAPLGDTVPVPEADMVGLRGFRARRSHLEAALAGAPGVRDVAVAVVDHDGDPRLVAFVVAAADTSPSLSRLRHALWAALPGSLWPSRMVVVDAIARRPDGTPDLDALPADATPSADQPDPDAVLLASLWGNAQGTPMGTTDSYWQDFTFLAALAEARRAGLVLTDEQVTRCRTPEMLAAALAVQAPERHRG